MAKKKRKDEEFTGGGDVLDSAGQAMETDQNEKQQPEVMARARFVGNSPLKVKQEVGAVMLWPNQVYKNLERTEDVEFLLKKRLLQKIS